ncbi:alpha,alpha-trehalase [candidate division KSB1 bacterium]|nr:alpha,alpha-trehalase [candidate division KSB1 bacterium]
MHSRNLVVLSLFLIMIQSISASGRWNSEDKNITPLPVFKSRRHQLPHPVYDADPVWLDLYWKSWQLAFQNLYQPTDKNGFVSNFIDAAFNQNIFLWDTCFMTMFCNYAYRLVPGIESLDNFYAKQHKSGEICREISRLDGKDFFYWINQERLPLFSRCGWVNPGAFWRLTDKNTVHPVSGQANRKDAVPDLTLDALNHPILAWAEWEHFMISGDTTRLEKSWLPLHRYFRALERLLKKKNGLYATDWASMDNSPRNAWLDGGGSGIDISAEMALFANHLARIAGILRKEKEVAAYEQKHQHIRSLINQLMWDASSGFYYDVTVEGKHSPVKTIAAFWTLLAGVPDQQQARRLCHYLNDPDYFGTLHRVPTLARDHPDYLPSGGYWRGAVWAPTNTMIIRGCERYGLQSLAYDLAMQHLSAVAAVFRQTGTIWENYAPESLNPGEHSDGSRVKADFVGWSGIGPILYFIEYAIGLKADAPRNRINWTLNSADRVGCKRFCFNDNLVDLVAEAVQNNKRKIDIKAENAFTLLLRWKNNSKQIIISAGETSFMLDDAPL